jgi:TATA-box binding protein (TBP) (component of TFIID and TFIIIB)
MGFKEALTLKSYGKHFNNSLVFNLHPDKDIYMGKSRKKGRLRQSIKVFCNGNLHLTGFKSLENALYIGEVFATMLEIMHGGDGLSDWYVIKGHKVQLVNFCYTYSDCAIGGKVLNLEELHGLMKVCGQYYCIFNNERYSGLIIKAPDFKILVFDSGSIILCLTDENMLLSAYTYINDFLKKNKDVLL